MSESENDSEIVKEFLVESYENLDRLDRDLVGLEKNPHDAEALAGVFRTIHSLQRMLTTPHNCPVNATMEVIPRVASSAAAGTLSWQPSISSKTSFAANAISGIQSSRLPLAADSLTDFMISLPERG